MEYNTENEELKTEEVLTDTESEGTPESESTDEKDAFADGREFFRGHNHYIKREERSRDMKDSAIALTTVAILGFALIILLFTGVLELPFNPDTMVLFYVAFIIIFAIFLVVGITSFRRASVLKAEAMEENELSENITAFLKELVVNNPIETGDANESESYFIRVDALKAAILEQYGELDDAYVDDIIEDCYSDLFPEEVPTEEI